MDWKERWKQNMANKDDLKMSKKKLKKWKKKNERENWERMQDMFWAMRTLRAKGLPSDAGSAYDYLRKQRML